MESLVDVCFFMLLISSMFTIINTVVLFIILSFMGGE